jgi:hypothetical protein
MPETPIFGFEFETPQTKPGISLTGNQDGSSPILAEQIDTALAGIDARVSANEGDIAALQATAPSDTGWIALTVTPASGFDLTESIYRQWGPVVSIRVQVQRTGSTITANSEGNIIGDPSLFTINTVAARPSQPLNVSCQVTTTSGAVTMFTSGLVNVTDLHSNSDIATDDFVRVTQTYFSTTFV